eukprot:4421919-Pyramimonas_sp.AAC.1
MSPSEGVRGRAAGIRLCDHKVNYAICTCYFAPVYMQSQPIRANDITDWVEEDMGKAESITTVVVRGDSNDFGMHRAYDRTVVHSAGATVGGPRPKLVHSNRTAYRKLCAARDLTLLTT